jgi:acyl carrier protein
MSNSCGTTSPLDRFPPEVRAAFERFKASRDVEALTVVVVAIVVSYMPVPPKGAPVPVVTPDKALIADLGFDSIAIAETLFFFEDLFGVTIGNQELMSLRTVSDLCRYIECRAGAARTGS